MRRAAIAAPVPTPACPRHPAFNFGDLRNTIGGIVASAADRLTGNAQNGEDALPAQTRLELLLNAARGAGAGRVDTSAFAPLISSLDTNGDGQVDINDLPASVRGTINQQDLNHDGRVDIADLQALLTELDRNDDGRIDLADLPDEARSALIAGIRPGGGGVAGAAQAARFAAIQARLQQTAAGRQILQGLDTNGNGQISPQVRKSKRAGRGRG